MFFCSETAVTGEAISDAVTAGLGKDIELRHQRNPDVIFDCMRKRQSGYGVPSRMQP